MTYCVGILLDDGIVCLSDTRTNAGVDNIAKFKKMFTWNIPGERVITMMTSGNLSITQHVMSMLDENIAQEPNRIETILEAPSMFRVAEVVADAMGVVQSRYGPGLIAAGESTASSILVAGQVRGGINGGKQRMFQVYSAGNFIEATDETNFFQLGEHKYGKPILDRVVTKQTSIDEAVLCALTSMDSTLRSNLSVGMPLDLCVIRKDQFKFDRQERIEESDLAFSQLSNAWSEEISKAFKRLKGQFDGTGLMPSSQDDKTQRFERNSEQKLQQQQHQQQQQQLEPLEANQFELEPQQYSQPQQNDFS